MRWAGRPASPGRWCPRRSRAPGRLPAPEPAAPGPWAVETGRRRALRRDHAVHLRQLAEVDPAAGRCSLRCGAAGGGSLVRVGAAEAGGWDSYQGMVYCWNFSTDDYTSFSLGYIATLSSLYST